MKQCFFVLAALAALVLATDSRAGWGAGGCSQGSCSLAGRSALMFTPFAPAAVRQGWYEGTMADGRPCFYWYYQGQVTAGYDAVRVVYRDYDGGHWSAPKTPPWQQIKQCACGGDYHRCDCDTKACACPGCQHVAP